MAALSAHNYDFSREARKYGEAQTAEWPLADGVTIYMGALLGLSDDSYVGPLSTTYRYGFVGIADESYDNSDGDNASKYIKVIQPPFLSDYDSGILQDVTYTAANMGTTIFCNTDNISDVTLTPDGATSKPCISLFLCSPDGCWWNGRTNYVSRSNSSSLWGCWHWGNTYTLSPSFCYVCSFI